MRIAKRLENSPELQAKAWAACSDNPIFFINTFGWTHDPRLIAEPGLPADIPFKLFEYQEDLIRWTRERLRRKESGAIEKSRDTGITSVEIGFSVWLWLFQDGANVGWGSRKEDLVDKRGNIDSIFEKARHFIRKLPNWMVPDEFELGGEHDNHMRLVNPKTESIIKGEAGDNIGRGGRSLIYFVDESAFLERAETVKSALSNNTESIIDISTPNGVGNQFYKTVHNGHTPVFTVRWQDDPRKDREWYEDFKREHGPTITARELDLDYQSSIEGLLIPPKWVRAAREIDLEYGGTGKDSGLDVADGGHDETVQIVRRGPVVESIDAKRDHDGGPTKTARWAWRRVLEDDAIGSLFVDEIGVGAGVVSELTDLNDGDVKVEGVNVGESPTRDLYTKKRTAREMFANLKAQLCWSLRDRFRATYEYVEGDEEHDEADLISIPGHADLERDLSKPTFDSDSKGRIKIESKDSLKKRLGEGASPDYLDALVLAYAGDCLNVELLI